MSRQLRPRRSRPSYAGLDLDDDGAGPSVAIVEDEASSGSDFELEKDKKTEEEEEDEEEEEEMEDEEEEVDLDTEEADELLDVSSHRRASSGIIISKVPLKQKGKGKSKVHAVKSISAPGTSLTRTSKRQMYILPTPSVHHRHRAVPLFSRRGRVERLVSQPVLFGPAPVTMTNNFTQNSKVTDRVNKSWGYNVGNGPLWEMVEDRGWYKEAKVSTSEIDSETNRRPRVYHDVCVKDGWEVLSTEAAAPYLPTDMVTTEEGNLKPPPPIPCYFGSIDEQTLINVKMFDTFAMSEHIPESKSHIFSASAPAWEIDWCPIHVDGRAAYCRKHYLAVGSFPTTSHSPEIGAKVLRPSYASIQLWKGSQDLGRMRCEMVLCVDAGPAHELKWCPLPSHDAMSVPKEPRKLGILAGSFEDGSLSIYAVPDPADVVPEDQDSLQPVYIKLPEPLVRIELEETACWTIDWANSELLAVGTTNGIIAVYNVGPSIKSCTDPKNSTITNLLPTHYISVHQSAIRALSWIRAPPSWPSGSPRVEEDPTVIASGGYDGMECMTDIREGHGSVMNRTRDVINAMAFSPFAGGPITIDHENTVKAYSASPSMLGRGHTLLEPQGPVWSVSASDYHPQLAVGSADGSCLTTNTLRSTRRGGSVPFFVHKIYQLDYSRKDKRFRMLERFLPQETQDRPTLTRAAKGKAKEDIETAPPSTGAWPREVGVHRVVWNSCNGLAASGLLATATASGLCRIDVLWGRWIKDKVPYGGIEHIRRELDDDEMDIDSYESTASA
ncbi:hypothetical protein BDQ12DRAFT_686864 [Crucibulum laeve]|uniref:WD40-repeat-containing domain protein n=1 Tax=Crucibulum laeve TaxID=68775 RepID=A0A5C3LV21_9AGAR|nr:hypothetical protein BDQ12DRAFT_686864 [Crucibulum laeve]